MISRDDGTVVARDIELALDEGERDGSPEWWGTMMAPTLASMSAGQTYRIVLGDGRTGEFVVRRNTLASGVDRAVAIRGMGPLR